MKNTEYSDETKKKISLEVQIRLSINEFLNQTTKTYSIVSMLYIVSFCMGFLLILMAVVLYVIDTTQYVYPIVSAGIGFLQTYTILILKPIEGLQKGKANHALLLLFISTSIKHVDNWISYLRSRANSADSDIDKRLKFEDMKCASDSINNGLIELINAYSRTINKEERV